MSTAGEVSKWIIWCMTMFHDKESSPSAIEAPVVREAKLASQWHVWTLGTTLLPITSPNLSFLSSWIGPRKQSISNPFHWASAMPDWGQCNCRIKKQTTHAHRNTDCTNEQSYSKPSTFNSLWLSWIQPSMQVTSMRILPSEILLLKCEEARAEGHAQTLP